ncbi:MAG: DUF2252 domain-containing protein [Acidobacteria bacterium]|nr:MAG: DUF2252 domain-containing protein [Acidobacteriota bacterium]
MANFPCSSIGSSQDRRAQGQARRKQMKRQDHSLWDAKKRRHTPLNLLEESMRGRVPALVPLKYERMIASPFGYFRGAVSVMAADLSLLPHTGIVNQICGDAHVCNLGAYAAPDGRLVFDINDFDETTRAPFEWDLKRLATSLVLAGREAGEKDGFARDAVLAFLERYRKWARTFASMPVLEVARFQVHRLMKVAPLSDLLMKAERATPMHALESLTVPAKNGPGRIFREDKPVLSRLSGSQARQIEAAMKEYCETLLPERQHILAQYRPIDVCFKVVGTGSVGRRNYCIYLQGNGPEDPLFLQIKEEVGSSYLPYLDHVAKNSHHGRLVAEGQRAMQLVSDPFLGWTTIAHRDYLVRQLNDHKATIAVDALKGPGLTAYAEVCGELLARGHARSGDVQMIVGYLGNGDSFSKAIVDFAVAYADQTETDWKALRESRRATKTKAAAAKK